MVLRKFITITLLWLFTFLSICGQSADTTKQRILTSQATNIIPSSSSSNGITIIGLILSVVAITISILGYIQNRISERTKRKPVLVFEFQEGKGWYIKNVGNGPALNVVIAFKKQEKEEKEEFWQCFVRLPALAEGSNFHIHWFEDNIWTLGSEYTDFQKIPYTTTSKDDENSIDEGHKMKAPKKPDVKRWWEMQRKSRTPIKGFITWLLKLSKDL